MSELKQFFSPAAIANELAQRVIAMVTDEDRQRGVECDPNELLSWAKQWLLERLPLGSADTLESLSDELCEAFFADGGATTGDSPSAETVAVIIEKGWNAGGYETLTADELAVVAEAVADARGAGDVLEEVSTWLKEGGAPVFIWPDTVATLGVGFACRRPRSIVDTTTLKATTKMGDFTVTMI